MKRSKPNHCHVSPEALDWAISHITRHGDTDLFPVPFEYAVIGHKWSAFRESLAQTDLGKTKLGPHNTFAVPKMQFGFRIAHQLDPLDTLLYTAQVYELGHFIEGGRLEKDVVCSYRFEPTAEGDFYPRDNGWQSYAQRSRLLALKNTHALYVDIADFYNQIYLHRLCGSLEHCGVPLERAKNLERFLSCLNALQSQGIPVGPSASSLLAECCLIDVDAYLQASKVPFVRYVDDFRIFSDRRTLNRVLAGLTQLLYSNHRLSIQAGKTSILETSAFVQKHLDTEAHDFEEQVDARLEQLAESLSDLNNELGYGNLSLEDIPDEEKATEINDLLRSSFQEALEADPIRLGTLRHLLRQARAYSSSELYPLVRNNLHALIPIIGDVCRYIDRVVIEEEGASEQLGKVLADAVTDSDFASLGFVAMWVLHLVTERPKLMAFEEAIEFAKRYTDDLGIRPQALLARAHSEAFWVRQQKANLQRLAPWDRRAVIWAASVLPESERTAWLRIEKQLEDPLDAAIARYVKQAPPCL